MLLGASRETLAKLRICFEHFPEEMVTSYSRKRYLIEHTMPTLNLPTLHVEDDDNDINVESINIPETSENVQDDSNLVPEDTGACEVEHGCIQQVVHVSTVYAPNAYRLRDKLRRCKKLLYNKKRTIRMYREEIHRLRQKNIWEDVTSEISDTQRTFIDMIRSNFNSAPQVC